jgi:hypothetical protein
MDADHQRGGHMKTWIGAKRILFIPMIRPADENRDGSVFLQRVKRKVLFDFGPSGDMSFANYVHTVSRGSAWIDAMILEPIETPAEDLLNDPRTVDQARDYAATRTTGTPGDDYYIAMIGQNDRAGAGGTAQPGGWAFRTHADAPVGEFFMEAIHTITGLRDYYVISQNLDRFDPMAAPTSAAHPSAYTKMLLGWLEGGDIVRHGGGSRTYLIRHQAVSTPRARVIGPMAVKVPGSGGGWYIESRRNIDHFEASLGTDAGVIVYHVAIEDNDPSGLTQPFIFLKTPSGLHAGQQYQTDGLSVTVGEDFYAGVAIEVVSPPEPPWQCGDWGRQLVRLQTLLDLELDEENPDPDVVRSLQARIAQLEERMNAAGCR